MQNRLKQYLDEVEKPVPASEREAWRREAEQHLTSLVAANEELGATPDEAAEAAALQFGDADQIGKGIRKSVLVARRRSAWRGVASVWAVASVLGGVLAGFFAGAVLVPLLGGYVNYTDQRSVWLYPLLGALVGALTAVSRPRLAWTLAGPLAGAVTVSWCTGALHTTAFLWRLLPGGRAGDTAHWWGRYADGSAYYGNFEMAMALLGGALIWGLRMRPSRAVLLCAAAMLFYPAFAVVSALLGLLDPPLAHRVLSSLASETCVYLAYGALFGAMLAFGRTAAGSMGQRLRLLVVRLRRKLPTYREEPRQAHA